MKRKEENQDLKDAKAATAAEERLPVGRDDDDFGEARVVQVQP